MGIWQSKANIREHQKNKKLSQTNFVQINQGNRVFYSITWFQFHIFYHLSRYAFGVIPVSL